MAQNTTAARAKKSTQQKISLFNILTCLLCSTKARTAHICPNCSKFYCEQCIKQWINQGNSNCPNCHNFISISTIVNCNKLSQDLSNALQALIQLQTTQQVQCRQHRVVQTYYCQTCSMSICSDCIVLQTRHKGHIIIKISKAKMEFNENVLLLLSKIRKSIKQIQRQRQERIQLKSQQSQITKAKLQHLNNYIYKLKQVYEEKITKIYQKNNQFYQNNKIVLSSCQKSYNDLLKQVQSISHIQLVRRGSSSIQKLIQNQIQSTNRCFDNLQQNKRALRQGNNLNIVYPKFATKTFVLTNYTQLREKKDVIYSDVFFDGPLQWRLKIYPNGLEKKRDSFSNKRGSQTSFGQEYISIYIQLVSGVRQTGRYQFAIQILNQNDQSKVISQIYEADFDSGKCWGYDEFANILTLYQKGYVNTQTDSLKISISVGPPSFYFSTLDQQAIIEKKHNQINQNMLKINELRSLIKEKYDNQNINASQFITYNKQNLIYNTQPQLPTSNNQQIQTLIQDVRTPRQKLSNLAQNKGVCKYQRDQCLEEVFDFQNYAVQMLPDQNFKCNQQFDHQSAELRKIYRRLNQVNQRSSLLLF